MGMTEFGTSSTKLPLTVNVGNSRLVSLNGEFAQGGGSLKRLRQAETLLWQGQVDAAKALFADCTTKQAQNFINYLDKHCDRIVNYQYYQAEQICSIGSGAVESAVKQIDRRTKSQALSGTRRMFLKCWLTVVLI